MPKVMLLAKSDADYADRVALANWIDKTGGPGRAAPTPHELADSYSTYGRHGQRARLCAPDGGKGHSNCASGGHTDRYAGLRSHHGLGPASCQDRRKQQAKGRTQLDLRWRDGRKRLHMQESHLEGEGVATASSEPGGQERRHGMKGTALMAQPAAGGQERVDLKSITD